MNAVDKLGLLANLDNEYCELNHGPDTRREDYQAVDYITQPFGYSEGDVEIAVHERVIPVCRSCMNDLLSGKWLLLVCWGCSCSVWFEKCRTKYNDNLRWVHECPNCKP